MSTQCRLPKHYFSGGYDRLIDDGLEIYLHRGGFWGENGLENRRQQLPSYVNSLATPTSQTLFSWNVGEFQGLSHLTLVMFVFVIIVIFCAPAAQAR